MRGARGLAVLLLEKPLQPLPLQMAQLLQWHRIPSAELPQPTREWHPILLALLLRRLPQRQLRTRLVQHPPRPLLPRPRLQIRSNN